MKGESILKGNAFFDRYIRKHFLKYVLILGIYVIGFLIGIGSFHHMLSSEKVASEVTTYMAENLEQFEQNQTDFIHSFLKEDWLEFLAMVIVSCSLLGVPVMLLGLLAKSMSLGITVSALIYTNGIGFGMSFSILLFLLPALLKMLAMVLILCSSMKLLENLLRERKELKYELVRHGFILFLAFLVICGLALYRAFSLNVIQQVLFS